MFKEDGDKGKVKKYIKEDVAAFNIRGCFNLNFIFLSLDMFSIKY